MSRIINASNCVQIRLIFQHQKPRLHSTHAAQATKMQELTDLNVADAGLKKSPNAYQQNLISLAPQSEANLLQQQQQLLSSNHIKSTTAPQNQKNPMRSLNAEKLRRGLTNFMNHLNPAPFFVPPAPLGSTAALASVQASPAVNKNTGSQAEPATIITDGPTADAVIKGPNRLVQARPLGGPLRWGRR